jgi:hypothetical protein
MAYNAKPNRSNKYRSGTYSLINENKYIADPSKIIYRSGLEYKFCKYVDRNPKVLKWGSEIVGVPYTMYDYKLKKNTSHTYWVDFYIEVENLNNPTGIDRLLVEVKPDAEYQALVTNTPPKKPKTLTAKKLETWEYNLKMFITNKHKWVAAQNYARMKHMTFVVVTEKILDKLFK